MTQKRPLVAADLYRLRMISDPQIAPDGNRVAFVIKQMDEATNDYTSNIYVVDRHGSVRQFTGGNRDWGPRWSPDGRNLAFVSGRKDAAQLYLLPVDGGESLCLTDLKLGAGLPIWSPDSTAIAFVGQIEVQPDGTAADNEEQRTAKIAPTKIVVRSSYKLDGAGYIGNRRRHVFVVELPDRSVRQITDGDHHADNPTWSPDSQTIAFSSGRSRHWDVSAQSDILLITRNGGNVEVCVPGGQYGRPIFNPDGTRLVFYGHRDLDNLFGPGRLYSVNRSGADFRDELGDWDGALANQIVSDVVLSSEPHQVCFTWHTHGIYAVGTVRGESNVLRIQGGAVDLATQGRHAVTDFSILENGTMAYTCADATHLSEIFISSGEITTQLTQENTALYDEISLVSPERIRYVGARGEPGDGWLLAPPNHQQGTHPLIVYIHGGPMLAHGEALMFEYQLLAGQGFGVFYPNIHGSSSYGHDYQVSIRNDWGNLDYQDVLAGIHEATSRSWVDRDRVGIAGGSYGGYMTNWAITHDAPVRAAVTERCLSNMISFMGTSDTGWSWNREFGVYPEQDVQRLWDMSPLKYVENVRVPVLVMHSEGDDRTPLEQGEQIFNALRRLGKPTKLVIFPEESHGLSRMGKPSRRVERLNHILDWFREHL